MSKQTYINGFCKAAGNAGVNSNSLANYALGLTKHAGASETWNKVLQALHKAKDEYDKLSPTEQVLLSTGAGGLVGGGLGALANGKKGAGIGALGGALGGAALGALPGAVVRSGVNVLDAAEQIKRQRRAVNMLSSMGLGGASGAAAGRIMLGKGYTGLGALVGTLGGLASEAVING